MHLKKAGTKYAHSPQRPLSQIKGCFVAPLFSPTQENKGATKQPFVCPRALCGLGAQFVSVFFSYALVAAYHMPFRHLKPDALVIAPSVIV
jgi:hypothetical protein